MDFHSLTRRELQALCKKNGIPANTTNLAMADALTALHSTVQGIEEVSDCSKSVTAQSSVESPERVEVTSPRVPRTRTTRKKVESTTVAATTTTTRRLTRTRKDGVEPMNIDVQFRDVDKQSEISKGKEACIPQTPSMVSDTRKRSSRVESTTTKAYNTRRSTRLAAKTLGHTDTSVENKENPDAANMKLFSADCGDNQCCEDVPLTVFHLKEDASETGKCNETKGYDIHEEANIENMDEIIGENGHDTNEQAEVETKDEVPGNNDDVNLVAKLMDMSLTSNDGVITQIEDHDGGILVPNVNDGMPLGDNAETESHAVSDAIVVDEFVPKSEEEEHVLVNVAAVEQVDKIDCDEPSQEYSKEDELLPKLEVEDLVNGGLVAETDNHAVSNAIVVDEFVPMSEEEEHVLVTVVAGEHVDKIDCYEQSQEYSKKDQLLPELEVANLVNDGMLAETENHAVSDAIVVDEFVPMSEEVEHVLVKDAAGEQLVYRESESLFNSMSSDEEEDLFNVAVGEQLVNCESGKQSQENSKDDSYLPKSFSMEESSEEEGSEDESEEGSKDESEEESEDESEEESEDDSEKEDLVDVALGGQQVNCDSDKPSELFTKEERSGEELEEVEDLVKVAAAGAENSKKDASSKASVFVDDSEGILLLPSMTAPPTPGTKKTAATGNKLVDNPNKTALAGKENLEDLSMRQIRKMIKNININADSKNDKKDNLVKKSDEELEETALRRTALQMLPQN